MLYQFINPESTILHIDADSFFAACEVARQPQLKGRPVVTGLERGIVSSLSYEAKALGIKRGMPLFQVKRICPDIVFLPSDYEMYSLYSCRLFEIVRRFSPQVEEYSIDECFADLSGLQRPLRMSYLQIAQEIQECLDKELGFSFSLGLAQTKILAKLASNWEKPAGLTRIAPGEIQYYLKQSDVSEVWGIGPQTTAYLNKLGIRNAWQFAQKNIDWLRARMNKTQIEIWQELQGMQVFEVTSEKKDKYQSISKTKTFTPPSRVESYIFSHLSKNVENACIKLRRYKLATQKIYFFLKTQDFKIHGYEFKLTRPSDNPIEIIKLIDRYFSLVISPNRLYRASGVVFMDLRENVSRQADLFNEIELSEKLSKVFSSLDAVSKRYGRTSLFLGSSLAAICAEEKKDKEELSDPAFDHGLLKGDFSGKNLGLPFLGDVK